MTLTAAAKITKLMMLCSGIIFLLGMIGWVGWSLYLSSIPKPPPPVPTADTKFGPIISAPKFPNSDIDANSYTYSLDTATGDLKKDYPTILKVYFTPKLGATLLGPNRAKELATSFGFADGPVNIDDRSTYPAIQQFSNGAGGILSINMETANFKFNRNEASASTTEFDPEFPSEKQIIANFKKYLSSKNLLPQTLDAGVGVVKLNKSQNPDSAEISIMPDKIDTYPVVTPTFDTGLVSAKITRARLDLARYFNFNFTFWDIDPTQTGTYPLKTVQQALEDMKQNKGVIIRVPEKKNVSITDDYLAYYESAEYPTYIQPVFVFTGPNFAALVPAIQDANLAK